MLMRTMTYVLGLGLLGSASASQINVTTMTDEFGVNGSACSLREAVQAANTHTAFGGCVAGAPGVTNFIVLPPGVYVLSRAGNFEDNNASGDLDVSSDMNISALGGGPDQVVIDGNGGDRIFDIRGASAVLNGLTLRNGQLNVVLGAGGAVLISDAIVDIKDCVLQGNSAWAGGAVYVSGPSSKLTIENSSVVNNHASFGGGIVGDSVSPSSQNISVRAATISGNISESAGGGIYVHLGTLTLNNATIAYNESNYANASPQNGGGGIFSDTTTVNVTNSIIADNRSHAWLKPDCDATFNRFDYSLISNSNGCNFPAATTGSLLDREPYLAPLFDYGGHTLSHHPRYPSPAINAGSNAAIGTAGACESLDQRHKAKQGRCDMGAVQWNMDFVVNSKGDAVDDNPGDGICHTASSGCTLRAAIMETNAAPGTNAFRSVLLPAQTITLALAGGKEDMAATGDLDLHTQVNIFGTVPPLPITHASVDANGIDGVFDIDTTATLVDFAIRGGALAGNTLDALGGGIHMKPHAGLGANVLLSHALVTDNVAAGGGGIYAYSQFPNTPTRFRADHCAITGNSTNNDFYDGGGLYLDANTETVIDNCTIAGNSTGGSGGGIRAYGNSVAIIASTIAYNVSNTNFGQWLQDNSGGGISAASGTTLLSNTIVAQNRGGRFGGGFVLSDCLYNFDVFEQNLVQTPANCTFTPLVNGGAMPIVADPLLVHGYYGGTLFPLAPASPAYQAVPNDECRGEIILPNLSPPAAQLQFDDQVGNPRPAGAFLPSACSLGAYEGFDADHIFADGFQGP